MLGGAGFHDLLDQLRQGDTDLILVGKSETNSAFVEKLARKAPCSVMVVPSGRSVAYRRILVTTDFSNTTNLKGVFAGGDLSNGFGTVAHAIRSGRKAADAIHAYLAEKSR